MSIDIPQLRQDWLGNIRGDTLSGLVVALALIPEAIAFSIIAGVDPKVGLYASFCIAVVIAFSGGRPGMILATTGRLSKLVAGVFLLILVVFAGPWVRQIPMAALVAVMIMVSISTFSQESIPDLRTYPRTSNVVNIAPLVVTVFTHDLAKGVLTGVLLSGLFFARKVDQVLHIGLVPADGGRARHYTVTGQVFFASLQALVAGFDFREVLARVRIDVSAAHFWDLSAVGALDRVVLKFRRERTQVELVGMNEASATLVDSLGVHDRPDADRLMDGH